MKGNMYERCKHEAIYMLLWRKTVRETAKRFNVSKTTVHKDVTERLKEVDPALYRNVKVLIDMHKNERHIRGGKATKKKYQMIKNMET